MWKAYQEETERLDKVYPNLQKSNGTPNYPSNGNGNRRYTPYIKPTYTKNKDSYLGRFGLRGGVNLASIQFGTEATDILLSYHVGVMVNIPLSKTFSIQPELTYTVKGEKDKVSKEETKVPMIELPVLLKYKFGSSDTKFFVNAGGYGAYVLNVDGVKLDKTSIEYGAVGGFGVEIPTGEGKLLIEGRYIYSLGNSNKDFFTVSNSHTTVIGFLLGYFY